MNRYKNTKIYIIKNDVDDKVYIGSTTQKHLCDRMWKHSSSSMDPKSNGYNCSLYQHMRKLGQFAFEMELLEEYPCETKLQMVKKEQEWMDKYDNSDNLLNQRRAVRC